MVVNEVQELNFHFWVNCSIKVISDHNVFNQI